MGREKKRYALAHMAVSSNYGQNEIYIYYALDVQYYRSSNVDECCGEKKIYKSICSRRTKATKI